MSDPREDGVVASGVALVEVAEAEGLLATGGAGLFSEGELLCARAGGSRPASRLLRRMGFPHAVD